MLGAILFAAAAAPQIGELKTFKDWIVGCDNGLLCQASAMMPTSDIGATLTVRRNPQGDAVPEIWFRTFEAAAVDLAADGKRLGLHLKKNEDDAYVVAPADAARLLDALRTARSVVVIDQAGKDSEKLLVDGATAALLFIDEQQHRLGTQGALVRRGDKPDSAVPAPPALPIRYRAKASAKPPARLPAALIAKVRKDNDCDDEDNADLVSHYRVDATHSFASITLMCVSGAYNYFSEDFIIVDGGKPIAARFDDDSHEEGDMAHYNLSWDEKTRLLTGGFKGRGIGDCGSWQDYVWDGQRFRVVSVQAMDDCRGVIDFISLWRARIVDR